MSFGLKNTGTTYQSAIQACLAKHWGKRVEGYIDDVVVKTRDLDDLIDDLQKANQWFYLNRARLATWEACSNAFLAKYFPLGKTSSLRNKISSFQQLADEMVAEAWERLQEYIAACPHNSMEQWLIIQSFFHGLHLSTQEHLDAAAGASFLSLSVATACTLIEKMASNQGWKQERAKNKPRAVHHIDGHDMLTAKMDLLLKKLEDAPEAVPVHAQDSRMTCEHCANISHTGNSCPGNGLEDVNFINNNNFSNGPRPQPGWNSRPHLPFSGQGTSSGNSQQFNKNSSDQKAMNDSISKKFHANDRILETLSLQMETLNSAHNMDCNKCNENLKAHFHNCHASIACTDSSTIINIQ